MSESEIGQSPRMCFGGFCFFRQKRNISLSPTVLEKKKAMKNILIIIVSLVLGMSCEKEAMPEPAKPRGSVPHEFNLDWKCPSLGLEYKHLKPTKVVEYVEFDPSTGNNEPYGVRADFYTPDGKALLQFSYEYGKGVTQGFGSINGKTFITNMETKTINICGGGQNVPVEFDLFSGSVNS